MQQNTLTLPAYKRLEKCGKYVIVRIVSHEVEVQFEQIAKNTINTKQAQEDSPWIRTQANSKLEPQFNC